MGQALSCDTVCVKLVVLNNTVNGVPTNTKLNGWSIRIWEAKLYPAGKGTAPVAHNLGSKGCCLFLADYDDQAWMVVRCSSE